ncbi:tetratricopeptide repeat protein [Zhouia sp. PK063]|uniref:tetratricopeptide repeat protein n=1 Tax=Zhouia sp. PK063 TaxID=3373602 RepID=UPI003797F45E
MLFAGMFILPQYYFAQDESDNASVTTEKNDDVFQETFFEALKEKGIENNEKALHLFQKCHQLQPENAAVNFELGKLETQLQHYPEAQSYLQRAIKVDATNIWYKAALLKVYEATYNIDNAVKLAEVMVAKNHSFQDNLVDLYTQQGDYNKALQLLKTMKKQGDDENLVIKEKWIRRMMHKDDVSVTNQTSEAKKVEEKNPLATLFSNIDQYIKDENYTLVLDVANENLELYPAQPKLYYAKGLAQNRLKFSKKAIESLQTALDFLLDDSTLEQKIYKELILAYTNVGNTKKADEFRKKIKG